MDNFNINNYIWSFPTQYPDKWKIIYCPDGVYALNDKQETIYLMYSSSIGNVKETFEEKVKQFYKDKNMDAWNHLKKQNNFYFVDGSFECSNGLKVDIIKIDNALNLRIGGSAGNRIGVDKATAKQLSDFFADVHDSL